MKPISIYTLTIIWTLTTGILFADEMTPEHYQTLKKTFHKSGFTPSKIREGESLDSSKIMVCQTLAALVSGGAVSVEGEILEHEIFDAYLACLETHHATWPTYGLPTDTVSPDILFKLVRAAIGIESLNAKEALEFTQEWCDKIPSRPCFTKDKHKLERASCSRLREFYKEALFAQQNPESKEAQDYHDHVNSERMRYQAYREQTAHAQEN